ncbi:type II secretion system F family protein [Candidatus Woesearchaeota archaeon]|nr:type II secretion system F family protein [Candidatus Woesearchaeota archaeon]
MHKNAPQLLREVTEFLAELEVYAVQRDSFLADLKRVDREYQEGRYGYLRYEEKQKALLRGRSREEWASYYAACIYSLLKKVEFVVSQVIALVYDDNSFSALRVRGAAQGVAAVSAVKAPAQQLIRPAAWAKVESRMEPKVESKVEVFNIDNEIDRLKRLLASRNVSPEQLEELAKAGGRPERAAKLAETLGTIKAVIPRFEDVAKDIEEAERKAEKLRSERARLALKKKQPLSPSPFNASAAGKLKLGLLKFASNAAKAVLKFVIDVPVTAAKSLRGIVKLLPRKKAKTMFEPAAAVSKKQDRITLAVPQKENVLSAVGQLLGQKKKKGIFVEAIVEMEKRAKVSEAAPLAERKEPAGLAFGWFSAKGMLRELTEKFRSKQEPILAERTAIPVHMRKLKEMRRKIYEEERLSGFDTTLLAQEARRIKKILEVEKPEVYQGSSVGLIANLTVRKVSLFLVDTFPEFFGFLYNGLRAANVKVLSNTYVNIMILSTLFVVAVSFFMLNVVFFTLNYSLYQIILRAVILSAVAGFACATVFYAYPFMKIKERRRNIMTNMPFAVNHMAAVATSGVPPVGMFELIAASREYAEIGVEVKKIVDFINIFGYDLLTALRTVAATTPSPQFKEFLEGMVSTVETGGDLDRYLRQEADQAALTYNLERQRYNETVSTYSDIYTGVLIAAPLFFVAAMALVNLLGGTLGGIGVDVVMAVGAYAVIPLLNIAFLIFLQLTQPDV